MLYVWSIIALQYPRSVLVFLYVFGIMFENTTHIAFDVLFAIYAPWLLIAIWFVQMGGWLNGGIALAFVLFQALDWTPEYTPAVAAHLAKRRLAAIERWQSVHAETV